MASGDDRGLTSVVSNVLLVAVVVVISVTVIVGALTLLPSDTSVRPNADFSVEHTGGNLTIQPEYMQEGVEFDLLINGETAYTWTGDGATESKELSCLTAGDTVRVTTSPTPGRSYLIEDYTVQTSTACGLSGATSRFAYARVGDREMPLRSQTYDFTLAIDPDGPNSVNGDTDYATTNPWIYIERFDRPVEGFSPPVYVVVFADNVADWDASPTEADRERMADSFTVDESGTLTATPSGSEPTNDVYLVFKPDCEESQFTFVSKSASYDNQILLDGAELFVDSDAASRTTYAGPGVDCV